jgi:DNA modification methylase
MNDIWDYPRPPRNGHNAPFNIELIKQIIRLWSIPGDLICDPYSGSGTVLLAAMDLNRRFIGSEKLQKYYDLIIKNLPKE